MIWVVAIVFVSIGLWLLFRPEHRVIDTCTAGHVHNVSEFYMCWQDRPSQDDRLQRAREEWGGGII